MMEILYISNTTSKKYFDKLYKTSHIKPGQQVQKFNEMLLRGFAKNSNVHALSAPPATFETTYKLFFSSNYEKENNILYDYIGFISLPIIKQLTVMMNAKCKLKKWIKRTKNKTRIIICYALSPTLSSIALKMAKKHNIKCMAVVTDIPQFMNVQKNTSSIKGKLYNIYSKSTYDKMTKYDMYMLLTSAMSDIINPNDKPYIVIEGMVDCDMLESINDIKQKYHPKVVMYAGALFEKYGVMNLVSGFIKADIKDCALWLFGNGEMEDYLSSLDNDKIKYFGAVPNNEVVEHETHSTLLVNPRPSTKEFTKYSFPSKNMEYMMSGTPVLTCKLPGMPDEYVDYVYIAQDESADGLKNSLTEIMNYSSKDLHQMGMHAKEFVTDSKSNITQANKILGFIAQNL